MNLQTLKVARKRASHFGRHRGWEAVFDTHPLAAPISNYLSMAHGAISERDFLSALLHLNHIAATINDFCNSNKVTGDSAAEYWLELTLWNIDLVAPIESLKG